MHSILSYATLVAQTVKRLPTMWEIQVRSLGREDLLEKEMVTHSSILAWKIPWTEEPSRLQSVGSQRVSERLHFHFKFIWSFLYWCTFFSCWWTSISLSNNASLNIFLPIFVYMYYMLSNIDFPNWNWLIREISLHYIVLDFDSAWITCSDVKGTRLTFVILTRKNIMTALGVFSPTFILILLYSGKPGPTPKAEKKEGFLPQSESNKEVLLLDHLH